MAEEKIPVLTEVYKPKKGSQKGSAPTEVTVEVTPEMIAKITAQIKPRLEAEITDYVIDELRGEIQKAREEIVSSTKDFVDKTKADLKTEIPNMYHETVKLAEVNLNDKFADMHVTATSKFDSAISEIANNISENTQGDIDKRVMQSIDAAMKEYEPEVLANNQEKLNSQLEEASTALQASFDNTSAQLKQTLQESIESAQSAFNEANQQSQQTIIEQHQASLKEALDAILETEQAAAEQSMQARLDEVQNTILESHKASLSKTLEGQMQTQGEAAERALLNRLKEYQNQLRSENEQMMAADMLASQTEISERIEESTAEQVGLMHSQVGSIQQETFAKLREDFNAEKNAIFESSANHIKTSFAEQMQAQSDALREQFLTQVNGDLPEVQAVLQENIQTILSNLVPDIEQSLRDQLTAELKQLLLTVNFVLPE